MPQVVRSSRSIQAQQSPETGPEAWRGVVILSALLLLLGGFKVFFHECFLTEKTDNFPMSYALCISTKERERAREATANYAIYAELK